MKRKGIGVIGLILLGIGLCGSPNLTQAMVENEEGRLSEKQAVIKPREQKTVRDDLEKAKATEIEYAPGEIIVKFKPNVGKVVNRIMKEGKGFRSVTGTDTLDELSRKYSVIRIERVIKALDQAMEQDGLTFTEVTKRIRKQFPKRTARATKDTKIPDLSNIYKITLEAKNVDIKTACAEYGKDPNVEYAEPNYICKIQTFPQTLPNDTYVNPSGDGVTWSTGAWGQPYEDMWGVKKIQADKAWAISQGESVVVAVVDTGIDYNHEDIMDNIWINPLEIPANEIDDDKNGYIDDVRGWDFLGKDVYEPKQDNDPIDGHGHGTHVAGIIAAVGNNAEGIIGVAPKAMVMAVKGLDDMGYGTDSALANSLKYAADNGAEVISNSWGGYFSSQLLIDAVDYAYSNGCTLIAGAGNDNDKVELFTIANLRNVIAVSAFDQNDEKSYFSNYGAKIDVCAPGSNGQGDPYNILSLLAENSYLSMYYGEYRIGSKYIRLAGTSMATPYVSGLAALVLSKNPDLNNEELRQIIRKSADDVDITGWDQNSGYGRINAANALSINNPPSIAYIDSFTFDRDNRLLIIKGSAYGGQFLNYKVEYGVGSIPEEWIIVRTSGVPVTGDVLATLDLDYFKEEGDYLVKLSVSETNGEISEDRIVVYYSPRFILKWGDASLFYWPIYLTMDQDGFIYVSDFGDSQIQKFTADGTFVTKWSTGYWPYGISIDKEGYVWVVDPVSCFINKYSSDGQFITRFGRYGRGNGEFEMPMGIIIDKDGYIYVSDLGCVQKFTYNGTFIKKWGSYGTGDAQFNTPTDMAIEGNYLYVVDGNNHRIQKFTLDGEFVAKWGTKGSDNGKFDNPFGITIDGNNQVYITDCLNSRVQVFDTFGNFLGKWGARGLEEGQFLGWVPYSGSMKFVASSGICTDKNEYVYVVDQLNNRIQKFRVYNSYLWGDINQDGEITTADIQLLTNFITHQQEPTEEQKYLADLNANQKIDRNDWLAIQKLWEEKIKQMDLPMLLGDVNVDKIINAQDAILVEKHLAGALEFSELQKLIADTNANKRIDEHDVKLIMSVSAQIIAQKELPIELGDMDDNDRIDDSDFQAIAKYIDSVEVPTQKELLYGDINLDDKFTKLDLDEIEKMLGKYTIEDECLVPPVEIHDTTPPTGSIKINNDSTYTTLTTVTLNLSATDPESGMGWMQFSNDGVTYANFENFAPAKPWTLTTGDGQKTVWVRFKNNADLTIVYSDTIILDTTKPTGSIKINNDAVYTKSTSVTLTLSATDTGSGMGQGAQMQFSNDGVSWSTPQAYATTKNWTLTTGDGTKTVYVKFKDAAGNWSLAYYDRIILDTIRPTGTIKINNDAAFTNSPSVTLNLSAADTGSGLGYMQFSNDGVTYTSFETYTTTKAWTLTTGDGTKTVYVKFKDKVGNVSIPYSDNIILTTP